MAILAACIAALLAGAAFARGRPRRWRDGAATAIAGAGLAALAAGLGGDEPAIGVGLGIAAAALLARLARAGRDPAPALVVVLGLLGLRLGVAAGGWLPLHPDEAQYWDWSRSPDLAYLSKPGGIAWLIAGWTAIAGDGLAALRLLGLALAAGTMALAWRAARAASGDAATAWSATALAALLPLHACTAGLVTTDAPLLLCWAAALAVLLRTPAAGAPPAWWHGPALGLLLAAGLNAKYAMLYAPLALAAAAAGLPQVRAWLRRPAPWIALAIAACGLIPLLAWNAAHAQLGWQHLAGQAGLERAPAIRPLRLLEYLGGQLAVGFPAALLLPWAVAWAWRGRAGRPAAWLLACAALAPLAVLLPVSACTKVQPNWPAMAWIPAAILAAWWLHAAAGPRVRRLALAGAALAAAGALLVAAAPGLRARWPHLPPTVPERKLAGWDALAAAVEAQLAAQPERTLTLVGSYDLAAELAWHNRHRPRPVCADFGRRASQYDLWPGLGAAQTGWDAVFALELDRADALAGDLRERLPRGLAADFAACDQPRLVRVERGGRTWRVFLVVRLRGFDGTLDSARRR